MVSATRVLDVAALVAYLCGVGYACWAGNVLAAVAFLAALNTQFTLIGARR